MSEESAEPRSIFRRLFALALPVIGLNLLNVLALFVDTVMCARLPNKDIVLAALGYGVQIMFIFLVAMIGLNVGTVALVSRAWGAKRRGRVEEILIQSTMLTVVLGTLVATFGNLLAAPALDLLRASPAAKAEALRYVRPLLAGTVFAYLMLLYSAIFRGVGNTRTPFLVALFGNLINIFLNYGLILGNFGFPRLGVQGAAIGTVCSQAVNVFILIYLLRREAIPDIRLPLRPRRLDGKLVRELFRVGFPAAADFVVLNVSFLGVLIMLAVIDERAVAAHNVGLRIQSLAFVPGLGVAMATAAMIGIALGGTKVAQAREIARSSLILCLAIMSTLGLAFVVFAAPIIQGFDVNPDSPLGAFSLTWVRVLGIAMPIFGWHISLVGVLNGAGATWVNLKFAAICTLLIQLPLGLILGFPLGMGATGIWISFPIGFAARAVLTSLYYRSGRWAKTGIHT